MEEFNPKGWTACFVRIAEMLELNPSIRGLAGVSWFYDPAVPAVNAAAKNEFPCCGT
jgi:hypothetical protein